MTEPVIKCPNCGSEIRLTDSVIAPFLDSTRRDFDERLKHETQRIAAEEASRSKQLLEADLAKRAAELADLRLLVQEKEGKLAEAQQAQADALRQKMALDEEKRELDLRIQKGIQEGLDAIRDKARKDAEEQLGLKVAEKEMVIQGMQRQIEELKRKAEQGSQQSQGEVQELQLEDTLRRAFPSDLVEPVAKGEFGGDCLQRVRSGTLQPAGTILWEAKRTKAWQADWLPKLRGDQRSARADVALIATQVLPKGIDSFGYQDGVWICSFPYVVPLATALRLMLIEVSNARQSSEGLQTKTELIYSYLTGPVFRQHVNAIVEAFGSMKQDLDKERKALTAHWAKREKELEKVLCATSRMYGDLQGIAGSSVPAIESLEIRALGDGSGTGPDAGTGEV